MKTPMQELQAALKDLEAIYIGNDWMREVIGIHQALNLIEYIYLKKEKEQMLNAFEESRLTHPMIGFKHETFTEYYNETFNTNEK